MKTLLGHIVRLYVNSSIHVALSVYALTRITELYYNLPYNEPLDYFIFYGTITGYNFVKYAGIAKLHHRSLTKNLKLIQVFSLICFLLTVFYGMQLHITTLLWMLPFGVLTLFYVVPFLKGLKMNLRSVSSLKIVIIALVWSGVTVIMPLKEGLELFEVNALLLFVQRFLVVIVLTLPFDIRDLQYDTKTLNTIPQLIGVERTKKFGFVLLLVTLLLEFFVTPNNQTKTVFLIIFLILLMFLQRAKRKQSAYYASFFVEAIPILWWVLLILLN